MDTAHPPVLCQCDPDQTVTWELFCTANLISFLFLTISSALSPKGLSAFAMPSPWIPENLFGISLSKALPPPSHLALLL